MALGCGSYSVFVTNRGGITTFGQIPWTSVRWSRLIDEVSSAAVELTGSAFACLSAMRGVHPYQHELAVVRDGERVWAGPIVAKAWRAGPSSDAITTSARDIMQWTRRRRLHADHIYSNVDFATMFKAVVRDAMSVDNSPRLRLDVTPTGVTGSRQWKASQYRNAYDALIDLSNTELDWTVIDRTVMAHGVEIDLPPLSTLTDSDFVIFDEVSEDGASLTTDQIVTGDGFGEAGASIVARSTAPTSYSDQYGVHENVYASGDIRDETSAARLARSLVSLNREPMIGFTGGQLTASAGVSIADLVPGRLVPLALEEIGVHGMYRLVAVEGSAGPEHEHVAITVEPIGQTKQRGYEWAAAREASG